MEAKVDVRKLQLLNDRIIQTLEALNQVRVSVHGIGQMPYASHPQQNGLGHTSAPPPYGTNGSMGPAQMGWPQPGHPLSNQPPYGANIGSFGPASGFSHSPFAGPQVAAWQPQPSWQSPAAAFHGPSPISAWGAPYGSQYGTPTNGLSHSSPYYYEEMERRAAEQRASDPGRLLQSFPYGTYV